VCHCHGVSEQPVVRTVAHALCNQLHGWRGGGFAMGLARYVDGARTHEHGLRPGRADRPGHRSVLFSADGKDLCGCGLGERMGDIAIRVEGLSKRYCIGARQERYHTLRDTLAETVTRPLRQLW